MFMIHIEYGNCIHFLGKLFFLLQQMALKSNRQTYDCLFICPQHHILVFFHFFLFFFFFFFYCYILLQKHSTVVNKIPYRQCAKHMKRILQPTIHSIRYFVRAVHASQFLSNFIFIALICFVLFFLFFFILLVFLNGFALILFWCIMCVLCCTRSNTTWNDKMQHQPIIEQTNITSTGRNEPNMNTFSTCAGKK